MAVPDVVVGNQSKELAQEHILSTALRHTLVAVLFSALSHTACADSYAFAISWQPQFCEAKKDKDECKSLHPDRFDARWFSLHGLWPQTQEYCEVSKEKEELDRAGKWKALDEVTLLPAVEKELREAMPGMASYLERHEWTRHGSCSKVSPDDYFLKSMELLRQVNASKFGLHASRRVGSDTSLERLQKLAEESFGATSRSSVEYLCTARKNSSQALTEIRIHLQGADVPSLSMASSLGAPVRKAKDEDLCVGGPIYLDAVNIE